MPNIIKDPKTDIIIVDDQHPEAVAMIQALYSRDPRSVNVHLDQVRERGHEKFMATFYVGYGHKSIGDCGTTTLFFENGSLLLPKVIQDWRLYNGQEASTRYLDMNGQDLINPCEGEEGQKKGAEILERWMNLYRNTLDALLPFLKERFPMESDQNPAVYEKAIKAKSFDIARGLLPAGVTTFASWHTNLRQAYDHLHEMLHHPLKEMQVTARRTLDALKEKYPSSFSHKEYPATEEYLAKCVAKYSYFDLDTIPAFDVKSTLDLTELAKHADTLSTRPPKTELPAKFEKYGQLRFRFPLDFGSFRDIQRHRSGVCEMPILGTKHGFHPWYLAQLPDDLRATAEAEIAALTKEIHNLPCDEYVKQYYTAIGFNVACEFTGGLPSIVYISELRASQTVHPTLRVVAQQMGEYLRENVPNMALHHDMTDDQWNVKRGTQDIVKKAE
jgi:thymidylate synthase ThyX